MITFLSDFGTRDGYVAAVKGVLKSFDAQIEIIDAGHDLPPFDVAHARWALGGYYAHYPADTVHLCVIDPGVGSERKGLVVRTRDYWFVGPDNGLFDEILDEDDAVCYEITFTPETHSDTFHGRDIFAPVAARLALGVDVKSLAVKLPLNARMSTEPIVEKSGRLSVRPLLADRFGNIIFDLRKSQIEGKLLEFSFKEFSASDIYSYYQQAGHNEALFLWNSRNYLELAVNGGNAARKFGLNSKQDRLIIWVERV